MNNKNIGKTVNRILGVVVAIFLLVIIISAVEKKGGSHTEDILVHVRSLPDSSKLITEGNVITAMTRGLGRSVQGMPVADLDLRRIEENILEKDPFIKDADVYIDAENRLHIDVEQRQPIVRIIDAKGKSYYLDKEGNFMPLSSNFTARVPVATGYIPPYTPEYQRKKQDALRYLFSLMEDIQSDEFMLALAEQIFVTENREFIIVPKLGKQKILLGRYENIEDKFKRLKIFYKEALPYEGWNKYKTINLKFKGQVVCKKA